MLQEIVTKLRRRARAKRSELFQEHFSITPSTSILDLGGGNGEYICAVTKGVGTITVADISPESLESARRRGLGTVQLGTGTRLPFADREFDIVFCSSVIEHVTGPKHEAINNDNGSEFDRIGRRWQAHFADEVRRIGASYFVQTPYKFFLVESHTWLPFVIVLLPRPWLLRLIRWTNGFWPKKNLPDWRLLTIRELKDLFPEAQIQVERFLGMPKSIIAVSSAGAPNHSA